MSELEREKLIFILRQAGKLPGLRGWGEETVEKIVVLIKKPGVTEEWIEEKAERFLLVFPGVSTWLHERQLKLVKDFIRSFVEEMPAKKATVDEKFVEKWCRKFFGYYTYKLKPEIWKQQLIIFREMLKEARVEMKK